MSLILLLKPSTLLHSHKSMGLATYNKKSMLSLCKTIYDQPKLIQSSQSNLLQFSLAGIRLSSVTFSHLRLELLYK